MQKIDIRTFRQIAAATGAPHLYVVTYSGDMFEAVPYLMGPVPQTSFIVATRTETDVSAVMDPDTAIHGVFVPFYPPHGIASGLESDDWTVGTALGTLDDVFERLC